MVNSMMNSMGYMGFPYTNRGAAYGRIQPDPTVSTATIEEITEPTSSHPTEKKATHEPKDEIKAADHGIYGYWASCMNDSNQMQN